MNTNKLVLIVAVLCLFSGISIAQEKSLDTKPFESTKFVKLKKIEVEFSEPTPLMIFGKIGSKNFPQPEPFHDDAERIAKGTIKLEFQISRSLTEESRYQSDWNLKIVELIDIDPVRFRSLAQNYNNRQSASSEDEKDADDKAKSPNYLAIGLKLAKQQEDNSALSEELLEKVDAIPREYFLKQKEIANIPISLDVVLPKHSVGTTTKEIQFEKYFYTPELKQWAVYLVKFDDSIPHERRSVGVFYTWRTPK